MKFLQNRTTCGSFANQSCAENQWAYREEPEDCLCSAIHSPELHDKHHRLISSSHWVMDHCSKVSPTSQTHLTFYILFGQVGTFSNKVMINTHPSFLLFKMPQVFLKIRLCWRLEASCFLNILKKTTFWRGPGGWPAPREKSVGILAFLNTLLGTLTTVNRTVTCRPQCANTAHIEIALLKTQIQIMERKAL